MANDVRPERLRATDRQLQRLRELLELVVRQNPFQRRRLAGLPPIAEVTLDDLPPLTKAELLENQRLNEPFGTNLTYPLEQYTHFHMTSGSRGPWLKVLDTEEDWRWWRRALVQTFVAAGVTPADRVALTFSFGPNIQFWAAKAGLEELGAMGLALGGMTSLQRLGFIADTEATVLMCTPSYALRLAEVAVAEGMEPALDSIQRVICSGEPGASLPAVRSRIEEAFSAQCFDHAGLTEGGPFGYPCSEHGGLHICEEEFICEILDDDLEPAPVGSSGELVLTPLGRRGFPVIRYRTGDVVVNTDERCPAGHRDRWLPGGIVGRADDMVVIRGMNVYPSAIENAVREVDGAGEFRITFYAEPGGMDEIKLEVELPDGRCARYLQELMRQQLGLRVRVVPVATGTLPRTDAKSSRVVDLRRMRPVAL
jgi:phenylacetate-CoA ligase